MLFSFYKMDNGVNVAGCNSIRQNISQDLIAIFLVILRLPGRIVGAFNEERVWRGYAVEIVNACKVVISHIVHVLIPITSEKKTAK